MRPPASASAAPGVSRQTWAGVFAILSVVAVIWWHYGTAFYDRAIPFYDGLSYQEGYRSTSELARQHGMLDALRDAWRQGGSNVVLHQLFAAVVGRWVPSPREGMFLYLFGLHLTAAVVLFVSVTRLSRSPAAGLWSLAVWLAVIPFGLLRDGIGDQRLDLSGGAFTLIVSALGLWWLHRPSARLAALTGLAAALAALHRPVLVPSLAGLGGLFFVLAWRARSRSPRTWTAQIGAALLPLLVLAAPWFIYHFEALRAYYFGYGPDIANASFADTAWFNLRTWAGSFGFTAALLLVVGLGRLRHAGLRVRRRDLLAVIAAWLLPLAVLVAIRAGGNVFVQQASLFLPALVFATLGPTRSARPPRQFIAWLVLAALVLMLPFRLGRSLATERIGARDEVVNVVHQIAAVDNDARVAGFHDLPAGIWAMTAVARDEQLALRAGTVAFYPTEFGLTNDFLDDAGSETVREAVRTTLARIKQDNDLVLLPTVDTTFRLWNGLYSHRLIPLIRAEMDADPAFVPVARVGPIQEVTFDLYEIR